MVSPVDGLVVFHEVVKEEFIRKIKGFNFKLKDFFVKQVWPGQYSVLLIIDYWIKKLTFWLGFIFSPPWWDRSNLKIRAYYY